MAYKSEQELVDSYNELVDIAEKEFSSPRKEQILKLMDDLNDQIATSPASSFSYFHNCFPGGYVLHVINVVNISLDMIEIWKKYGYTPDFSREELIFCAFFHDLGKVGEKSKPHYVPETSDWHRKNMKRMYNTNSELVYMNITDRSFYMLQKYNIPISRNEYIGLKLADGLYEDANKQYYQTFKEEHMLKSFLPYIVHQADLTAAKMEWFHYNKNTTVPKIGSVKKPKVDVDIVEEYVETDKPMGFQKMFDELFPQAEGDQ